MIEDNGTPELFKAFVKAQSEFPPIPKNCTVKVQTAKGQYQFKYADLASIFEVTKPILHRHGLAVFQNVTDYKDSVGVETIIIHESGEMFRSGHVNLPRPDLAKDLGSLITYLKRYSYCAFMGITAEDDVDADPRNTEKFEREVAEKKEEPKEELKELKKAKEEMVKLFGERKITGREEMLDYVRDVLKAKEGDILSSADMMLDDVKQVIKTLKKDIETIKKTEA